MKLRTGGAVALMILLILAGVAYGAYHGWSTERARVEETYAGLESMLQTRIESAYNVLAVARRHVSEEDEGFLRVKGDLSVLENPAATLPEKAKANESLSRDTQALLDDLRKKESVQTDDRDKMYVESYLPQMLAQSEERTAGAVYNKAAAEFNSSIRGTFSGWIARLMGVSTAQEFIAQ